MKLFTKRALANLEFDTFQRGWLEGYKKGLEEGAFRAKAQPKKTAKKKK